MRYLRKLGGIAGFGVTWGVAWATVVVLLGLVMLAVDPKQIGRDEGLLRVAGMIWGAGFVSGAIFGTLVGWSEGGKELERLSLWRAAMWGLLSSAVFPIATGRADQVFWTCPVGVIVAVAMSVHARTAGRSQARERGVLGGVLDAFTVAPFRYAVTPDREASRLER